MVSCAPDTLKITVSQTASELQVTWTSASDSAEAFAHAAEDVYSHLSQYDLSTKGLDAKEGGIFDHFQNNNYYYKTVHDGASYYISPLKPVDEPLRREIRILQNIEGFLQKAYDKNADTLAMAFYGVHQPTSIGLLVPWADVVSFFPPGIDLTRQEWYSRGLNSPGDPRWSKGPFVSFYQGWVEDVAVPVHSEGEVRGVVVLATSLEKLAAKYFAGSDEALVLLGPDLTPFIATASARSALPLKVIQDFDYTKQLKENPFTNESYRLSATDQPQGLRDVAAAITAGRTDFTVNIADKHYRVYVQAVKEPHFYVVGFAQQ
jgi:hypothetical protein